MWVGMWGEGVLGVGWVGGGGVWVGVRRATAPPPDPTSKRMQSVFCFPTITFIVSTTFLKLNDLTVPAIEYDRSIRKTFKSLFFIRFQIGKSKNHI